MSNESKEYWDEINSCAQAAISQVKENGSNVNDEIIEMVSEHQFIIYYQKSLMVVAQTENRDAYDEFDLDYSNGFDSMCAQVAYFAMSGDIRDAIETIREGE